MNQMKIFRLLFILTLLLFISYSCQKSPKSTGENLADSTFEQNEDIIRVDEILTRFPAPSEMLMIMEQIKPKFKEGVLNEAKNHKTYFDSRAQALNIGVYSADLAYLSYAKRFKESIGYFNALYALSDKLEISSAFSEETIKRFQNNISNADSLQLLMDISLSNLSDYLSANNNERVFAVISIGGYIEAMYLSFHIVEEFSDNNPFIQRIADQKYVLENIISYSNQFSNDPMVKGAIDYLIPMKEVYDMLEIKENETIVEKKPDGKIVIKGGSVIEISEEQYIQLEKVVSKIRSQIVQK